VVATARVLGVSHSRLGKHTWRSRGFACRGHGRQLAVWIVCVTSSTAAQANPIGFAALVSHSHDRVQLRHRRGSGLCCSSDSHRASRNGQRARTDTRSLLLRKQYRILHLLRARITWQEGEVLASGMLPYGLGQCSTIPWRLWIADFQTHLYLLNAMDAMKRSADIAMPVHAFVISWPATWREAITRGTHPGRRSCSRPESTRKGEHCMTTTNLMHLSAGRTPTRAIAFVVHAWAAVRGEACATASRGHGCSLCTCPSACGCHSISSCC
jgi:hypothetical protein